MVADAHPGAVHLAVEQVHARRTDEIADERMLGRLEEFGRRADLHGAAVVHDHDLVGERQGFDLVVRDIDHQEVEGAMHGLQLRAQLPLQGRVDDGQRFVEEHGRDVGAHEAAAERDLLLGVGRQTHGHDGRGPA